MESVFAGRCLQCGINTIYPDENGRAVCPSCKSLIFWVDKNNDEFFVDNIPESFTRLISENKSLSNTLSRYYEALKHISTMACGFDCYHEEDQCHRMKAVAKAAIEPVDEVTIASQWEKHIQPDGSWKKVFK